MLNRRHLWFHHLRLLVLVLPFWAAACSTPLPAALSSQAPVEVRGLEEAPRDNVLALITPALTPPDATSPDPFRLRQVSRQAPRLVAEALAPFGYYAPTTTARIEGESLVLEIDPGEPVRIARIETALEGVDSPPLRRALARFPLATGDTLRHESYEKGKEDILAAARDLGFLDAHFTRHEVRVDPPAGRAEISLTLASGPLYRVGAIRFEAGDGYPEAFLRRHLTLKPGAPLTRADLNTTRQQLRDSGRFASVALIPHLDQADADGLTPITARLEAEPRRQLRPGVGYGTDTGARASLRYQDLNAFSLAHRFTVDGLLAEFKRGVNAEYTIPGRHIDTQSVLRGGFEGEYLDSYVTRYAFTEFEQFWGLGKRRIVSGFGRFQREDSEIGDQKIDTSFLLGGVRYQQGKIDNPIRPYRGYLVSLEWRGTNENLLSEVTLGQVLAGCRLLLPLARPVLLHLRANSATTIQENKFQGVPASLRFFAGGDRSVRGYAYQALGPKDENGDVTGGKNLLVGSAEVEWRPFDHWGMAGFYDIGNAFNSYNEMELAEAVGAGVRYYSVVGPIWLDVARTVATPNPDYRLHFGLGLTW